MAISISHRTIYIDASYELKNQLGYLGAIAYLAQKLDQSTLFNQAKETYNKIAYDWFKNAEDEAKKKSYKNWLGGGETYIAFNPNKWNNDSSGILLDTIFDELSVLEMSFALKYLLETPPTSSITVTDCLLKAKEHAKRMSGISNNKNFFLNR